MITRQHLVDAIRHSVARSAWQRGVREYAVEIISLLDDDALGSLTEEKLLFGAVDWKHYSTSGHSLILNEDIAKRLCNPSQLRATKNGEKPLGKKYDWLEVQAVALKSAADLILETANSIPQVEVTSVFGGVKNG